MILGKWGRETSFVLLCPHYVCRRSGCREGFWPQPCFSCLWHLLFACKYLIIYTLIPYQMARIGYEFIHFNERKYVFYWEANLRNVVGGPGQAGAPCVLVSWASHSSLRHLTLKSHPLLLRLHWAPWDKENNAKSFTLKRNNKTFCYYLILDKNFKLSLIFYPPSFSCSICARILSREALRLLYLSLSQSDCLLQKKPS